MKSSSTIDSYISKFPQEVQIILQKVRETIAKAAPEAEEAMKYGIPTFIQKGNLVHFGGFKQHIGFYPAPSGIAAFQKEFAKYEGAKGSVQFPLDKPVPYSLIAKVVKYRVKENLKKKNINETK